MATTYTHISWGHQVAYWWYTISESNINTTNNTSLVTVNFYVKAAHNGLRSDTYNNYPAGYGSSTPYSKIYINGNLIATKTPANFDTRYNSAKKIANGTSYLIGSASTTVPRNADGLASIRVKCYHYTSVSPGSVTLESSHNLQQIDVNKPASISASGTYNIGSNFNATISGGNGDSHTIRLQYGSLVNDVSELGKGTHSIKIPDSWKPHVIAGQSATATVYCYTYKNGQHIGTNSTSIYIKNPDKGATLSLPGGVHNIGSKFQFTLNDAKDYMRYSIWCYSGKNTSWIQHSHQLQYSNGNHTITFEDIPSVFKTGVPNQGTDTMYVVVYSYHNDVYLGSHTQSTTILNNDYVIQFNELYIRNDTYTENGKYVAGKTNLKVHYNITSTFSIKQIVFKTIHRNGLYGEKAWPAHAGDWESNTVTELGDDTLQCIVTDSAGHTATGQINFTVHEEEHRLRITSLEQLAKVYILKRHTIGNSKFEILVNWDNTHPITNISFNVSGANPMTYSKDYPGGKSFTWSSSQNVTKLGDNKITVTLKDEKGATASSSITIQSLEEAATMNIDNSIVDPKLCVDLVKNLAYANHSRLGVRIKVDHTHALETVKVTINERENTLKNIDPYAKEFTYIDEKKIEKAGDIIIRFYAKDVNGVEDTHTVVYQTHKIIEAPARPKISFETDENRILLSEGEKVIFEGESTDIKDYQVIYALSSCDIITATSFCNNISQSYMSDNQELLTLNLDSCTTGAVRFVVLKDFDVGVSDSIVTQDPTRKNKFHIHPLINNHDDNFYALQFLSEAKPGDRVYIYVRERKMGTFDMYLYSDDYVSPFNIPRPELFTMCVLPLAPCSLNIYKKEQTSDKIIIRYANPVFNMNPNNILINLIDVCLVAKDAIGNLLDKNGNKSKSENRKRDGLNGKTWIYYTDRQWHNIVPNNLISYHNQKEFEMIFDISKYPKGTSFSIVAFYYPDYRNHPSIYSTSNILNVNKSNIKMNLNIMSPKDSTTSQTPNPTFKIRVSKIDSEGINKDPIYEDYNLALKYNYVLWKENPIWFRVPRNKDEQVPNFTKGTCYKENHPYKDNFLIEPNSSIEYYNANKDIYETASLFRIAGASINDEGSFKENALFLRANNNNQVYLGDIETYVLLEKGYIDFTWTQKTGRFLSIGENIIEAFTSPYLYDNDVIDYEELQSYWISDTTLYSTPIMPYNPFKHSILKPSNKDWSEVEGDILNVKIPYGILQENKEYRFSFSHFADTGFFYEGNSMISNSTDLQNICAAYMFLNIDSEGVSGLRYSSENLVYSPSYTLVSSGSNTISEVNNYNKWINNEITFTTPNENKLIDLDKQNKYLQISIRVRGINTIKIKDFVLTSTDNSHNIDLNKGTIDVSLRENTKSIRVLYQGSIDLNFGYIDPLNYKDMIDLRDYLQAIALVYGVEVTPAWRTLIKDQSYLMACDFNDTKNYCIDLFTAMKKKYPSTFVGDVNDFYKIPYVKVGERRGPNTYSSRGKHYFPEWDDLLDVVFSFRFRESEGIQSLECATWSTASETWIRHNLYPYLKLDKDGSLYKPVDANSIGTLNIAINYKSNEFASSEVFDKNNICEVYYECDNINEKQSSQLYFFNSKDWYDLTNSKVNVIQVIFKIKDDPSHSSMDFTIDDFILSGHNYDNINQVINDKNNFRLISDRTNSHLIIGGCTAVNNRTDIVFICTPDELKKYKGVRLSSTSGLMNDYVQLQSTCIIKYYKSN